MFQSYTCELQTEGAYFARWFHTRIAECVIGNNMREITIDEGHGRARFETPKALQDFGNEYRWRVIEHDGYPDQSPEIAAELLALLRLDKRCIYFQAVPLAPSRLKVEMYCAGAELGDTWRCLLDNLAADYDVTPAGTVDQVAAVDGESQDADRPNAYVGTPEKVRETHRMRKAGKTWGWIRKYCRGCATYESYMRYCREYTGEDPLTQV